METLPVGKYYDALSLNVENVLTNPHYKFDEDPALPGFPRFHSEGIIRHEQILNILEFYTFKSINLILCI